MSTSKLKKMSMLKVDSLSVSILTFIKASGSKGLALASIHTGKF